MGPHWIPLTVPVWVVSAGAMSEPLWIGTPSNPIWVWPPDDPDELESPPELAAAVELELDEPPEPQATSASEATTSITTVRARTRIGREGSGRVPPAPQLWWTTRDPESRVQLWAAVPSGSPDPLGTKRESS